VDLDEDNASMTYRVALLGPTVFGRGYGTEATRLVRDFAFGPLGLHRLALEVNSFNAAAIAVYEKAGFVLEGVRREAVLRDGVWHDVHDMALLESDPRP
jgi:RimJ/RimL family protein N-acetyltransferase